MMELVADKRVRTYELTYILPAALATSDVAQEKDAVEKLLKKHSVKIVSQDDWGKKSLAYPIKYSGEKQYEGFYTHMVLSADPAVMQEFEKDLYLQQSVIRHLIVVAADTDSQEE